MPGVMRTRIGGGSRVASRGVVKVCGGYMRTSLFVCVFCFSFFSVNGGDRIG